MTDHQVASRGSATPQPLSRPAGFGLGGAVRSALGGFGNLGAHPGPDLGAQSPTPAAAAAGSLAGITKRAKGPVSHVAPALEAAARGETLAQQASRVTGPVKMTAADALRVAGGMSTDPREQARHAMQTANQNPQTGFHSPFVSIGLSGITNDQDGAEQINSTITGTSIKNAHGYAAYGSNEHTYASATNPGVDSKSDKKGVDDAMTDVGAVTQYAAAAELGITLTPNAKGDGRQVKIDWGALSRMDINADINKVGERVKFDSPAAVADNGYQAVLADMEKRNTKPEDKDQFISLTGHSGGGQSSFYTALKLASEGYKNVSLVGVDMAMTPHQREVLQALGVNVTNITARSSPLGAIGGEITSPVGDGIRAGMGGGQNFYDLNVRRQTSALDPFVTHGITNDANVATTVRFAQYLDSIGQHGQYTPEQYQQFLKDSNGTGNQVVLTDKDGKPENHATSVDPNLFAAGSTTVTDQRQRPGADQNSTAFGGGASPIETVINLLGGKPVTQAIQGVGNKIHNGFDAAGDFAKSAFGLIPKAGGFLGSMFNKGASLLGKGVNAAGNFLGNGLDKAGDVAQSVMSGVAGVSSTVGNAVGGGLNAVGNGVSSVGNTIGNGLDQAGDKAESWLGGIPLIGGFLGRAANKGMDLLGSGVSTVGNLLGNGVSAVGDAAQWAGGKVASGANAVGNLANQGLDAVGSGFSWLGGKIGSGLSALGGWGQSAISSGTAAVGNFLGNTVSGGLHAVGNGIGNGFNWLGDKAGSLIRRGTGGLVRDLQEKGLDTSQVAGLSDFQSHNPRERLLAQMQADEARGEPVDIQTIDIPSKQHAAPTANSHYAN